MSTRRRLRAQVWLVLLDRPFGEYRFFPELFLSSGYREDGPSLPANVGPGQGRLGE
jgi:hypothetical protein